MNNLIETAIADGNWETAQSLILLELKQFPKDHWLLTRLSAVEYEQKNYQKALDLADQALKIVPACALALWDRAGALDMLNRESEAIQVWQTLIQQTTFTCEDSTKSLVNDARYRLALAYKDLGKLDEAKLLIEEYLSLRKRGQYSLYTREETQDLKEYLKFAK